MGSPIFFDIPVSHIPDAITSSCSPQNMTVKICKFVEIFNKHPLIPHFQHDTTWHQNLLKTAYDFSLFIPSFSTMLKISTKKLVTQAPFSTSSNACFTGVC